MALMAVLTSTLGHNRLAVMLTLVAVVVSWCLVRCMLGCCPSRAVLLFIGSSRVTSGSLR